MGLQSDIRLCISLAITDCHGVRIHIVRVRIKTVDRSLRARYGQGRQRLGDKHEAALGARSTGLIVAVRYRGPTRVWHCRLSESLRVAGFVPKLEPEGARSDRAVEAVLRIEQRLYRSPPSLFDRTDVSAPNCQCDADLVVDLDDTLASSGATLEVRFDGARGDAYLVAALLRGTAPSIAVRRLPSGEVMAAGLPAIEDPGNLTRSLNQVLIRLVTLIVQAVRRLVRGEGVGLLLVPKEAPSRSPSQLAFVARGFARKLARRLGPAHGRPDHWRIGYRLTNEAGVATAGGWPNQRYTMLADDGRRFYADPFAFEDEGRRFIFFEDFPYATAKGVISFVEIGDTGRASAPRVALEQPVHLSYPLLMRYEDTILMLPEMSGARRVQLFRADPFPERWVPADVLVDGIVAADATPVWHDDRFWLFTTVAGDGGSSWDQLALFHAPRLTGPWEPHDDNPVLVDAGAARPAGAMWHEGATLMRVAQDCRAGYGAAIVICRVDRLDRNGFEQTVVARIEPPRGSYAQGVHTLNRCGTLEVVDYRVRHAYRRRPEN